MPMQHERIGCRRFGRPVYKTTNSVFYVFEIKSALALRVFIPKNFVHDFASIPWPLHYILPPKGPWARAAVVHDRLCHTGTPRFLADAIFRHVMEQDGVRLRCVLYYTVRIYWQLIGRWL